MAAATAAQTRVLTNSDLEKYRLEREKSEREYRETYVKKGFPSPEELDKGRRQNEIENQEYLIRLAEQLRAADRDPPAEALWVQQLQQGAIFGGLCAQKRDLEQKSGGPSGPPLQTAPAHAPAQSVPG